MKVINPSTNDVLTEVPIGGEKEGKIAVDAAFESFKPWARKTAGERSELLYRWYELIKENQTEIASDMTKEQGKPFREAIGEVNYANGFIQWYAEEAKRVYGDTIPSSHPNKRIFVQKYPVGVVAAITPWNFPAAMITRKVAPALAAGCTTVIKPAEETPLTPLFLASLAEQAGIPAGVINVVVGKPQEIGEAWLNDKRVRKLTFTGSTPIGKYLMEKSSKSVKKISLELGGHAPFIVSKEADLDKAVEAAIQAKFRNAGQTCVCANRFYVQESVVEEFAYKFTEAAQELQVGDGFNKEVSIGPLINEEAVAKVEQHVVDARQKGASVLTGGELGEKDTTFYRPTVILNAKPDMLCMNEETFGPLAPIAAFKHIDEAIAQVNDTDFGLAAYVFTTNLSEAFHINEELDYGIVGINDGLPSTPQAPFGGMKESGLGREGGYYGIEEYLETKYTSLQI